MQKKFLEPTTAQLCQKPYWRFSGMASIEVQTIVIYIVSLLLLMINTLTNLPREKITFVLAQ